MLWEVSAEEMPVLLAAVAGSATAGSLVVEFPASVATPHSYGTNGLLAIARKPLAARLDVSSSRAFGNSRFETRHSFPLGKRLRRSCLRASALQQTSTNSIKWVLDPVGKCSLISHRHFHPLHPSGIEVRNFSIQELSTMHYCLFFDCIVMVNRVTILTLSISEVAKLLRPMMFN